MPTWDLDNAAHLLNRAGFGGDDKDVAKIVKLGQAKAVEKLVGVKGSGAKGPGKSDDDADDLQKLRVWWAKRMVKATSRRLQEKMCLFWHDHFATAVSTTQNNRRMSLQNRTFRLFGLGDFKTLVFEVTRDAAMLDYLDGDRNKVGKPNENYAREVQELFTLGVVDLNGNANYTQTDVSEMARALTGWQIDSDTDLGFFLPSRFDGGTKTVYAGNPGQKTGNLGVVDATGTLLPPATNVLDAIFGHRDSDGELTMPRFIGKKLWEYFAYPGPSKALVDDVVAPFVSGGFVIRDLLRAIFLHEEFYSEAAKTSSVRNPCEYAFSAIRSLRARTNGKTLPDLLSDMGMDLFDPPSVNGWNNGFAWLGTGQFLARLAFGQTLAAGRTSDLLLSPTKLFDPASTDAAQVVDALLGHLHVATRVPAGTRQALIDYFGGATSFTDPAVVEKKVRGAVALMLALPHMQTH